jgi:hypothetical protein
METRRNNATGEIIVKALTFTVVVSEEAVKIMVGDAIVHECKPETGPKHTDAPSPREGPTNRKRGSR